MLTEKWWMLPCNALRHVCSKIKLINMYIFN